MLKNFVFWFLAFGLSFIGANLFGIEQGSTFFVLYLGYSLLIILLIIIIAGLTSENGVAISLLLLLFTAIAVGIVLLVTWGQVKSLV
ncbi:MAG: hypothetical protein IJV31_04990 [Clostridia bacterium]|nr:hypothetical protein [Clostridia bacterium]